VADMVVLPPVPPVAVPRRLRDRGAATVMVVVQRYAKLLWHFEIIIECQLLPGRLRLAPPGCLLKGN